MPKVLRRRLVKTPIPLRKLLPKLPLMLSLRSRMPLIKPLRIRLLLLLLVSFDPGRRLSGRRLWSLNRSTPKRPLQSHY